MPWPRLDGADGADGRLQEIKPSMIEVLKAKQSLKAAELQDGDIVCFQRGLDKKPGDRNFLEKRLGGDNKPADEA